MPVFVKDWSETAREAAAAARAAAAQGRKPSDQSYTMGWGGPEAETPTTSQPSGLSAQDLEQIGRGGDEALEAAARYATGYLNRWSDFLTTPGDALSGKFGGVPVPTGVGANGQPLLTEGDFWRAQQAVEQGYNRAVHMAPSLVETSQLRFGKGGNVRFGKSAARGDAIMKAAARRYRQQPKRLKNLRISEVSSVDRGAGEGCGVLLTKRNNEGVFEVADIISKAAGCRTDRELIEFAKSDRCTKAELSQLIDDIAQHRRQRDETREQAFTKFICNDPLGRDLYQVMKSAAGHDHQQLASLAKGLGRPDPSVPVLKQSQAMDDLNKLANEVVRKSGGKLTHAQAFTGVVEGTSVGKALMARAKAADLARAVSL